MQKMPSPLCREYGPHLCFMGGVDVRTLYADDEAVMEREVRTKLEIGMAHPGGYVFHSDHSIPPDMSLARYRRILDLVRDAGRYRDH